MVQRPAAIPDGFALRTESNTFMDYIGPVFERMLDRSVQLALVVEKRHTNPMGTTHGAVLMALMDVAMGSSAARVIGYDGAIATVQLSCNMIAAAREGELVMTEVTVERTTRTLSFLSGRVLSGDQLLTSATGVFRNPPERPK